MFNFFKEAFSPKKDTKVVIEEIHNAFDNAGERLLNEAKEILAKGFNTDKGDRLKKLGFIKAKDAVEAAAKIKEQKEKKELATLIEYYQTWYPNNKFINEVTVKAICEKYGLYCGEVGYYKGDVPEKNLREIENFSLREEDMETTTNYQDYIERMSFMGMLNSFSDLGMSRRSRPSYPEPPKEIVERKVKKSFQICAPEKDFEISYMRKEGHKLIPDPIVLQPVKGGYLIVSKWGLESEDETLVNEKMN